MIIEGQNIPVLSLLSDVLKSQYFTRISLNITPVADKMSNNRTFFGDLCMLNKRRKNAYKKRAHFAVKNNRFEQHALETQMCV